ncbi:MAG: hypothetical protein IPG42_06680 [Betaproteobacteria bacterium]|nr:hypothetical protein [Betaproteobacteria bacterium]
MRFPKTSWLLCVHGNQSDGTVQPGDSPRQGEIASSADPLTRTFAVKVALMKVRPPLGSTVFATPKIKMIADTAVIKLPTSALRQDGNSSAVRVLDPENATVKSLSVQVLTAEGIWRSLAGPQAR